MLIYPSGFAIEFGWVAPGLIGYQRTMAPPIWQHVNVPTQNPSPVKWLRVKVDPNSVAAVGGTALIGGIAWYYWAALPILAF